MEMEVEMRRRWAGEVGVEMEGEARMKMRMKVDMRRRWDGGGMESLGWRRRWTRDGDRSEVEDEDGDEGGSEVEVGRR